MSLPALRPGVIVLPGSTGSVLLGVNGEAMLLTTDEAYDLATHLEHAAFRAHGEALLAKQVVAEHIMPNEKEPAS